MSTVNQLLQDKPKEFCSISPDASVYEAIRMMAEKGIGALLVLSGDELIGLITERDYARQVVLKGRSSEQTRVRDIMIKDPIMATPDQDIEGCMSIMTDERVRYLPVMEGEQLLGIISMGDIVKSIIEEQRMTIDQLGRYIAG